MPIDIYIYEVFNFFSAGGPVMVYLAIMRHSVTAARVIRLSLRWLTQSSLSVTAVRHGR